MALHARSAARAPAAPSPTQRNFALRAHLMGRIVESAAASRLTQTEFAAQVGVTQPRLNALLRGRSEQFSLDALVNLATRCGLDVQLTAGDSAARQPADVARAAREGDRSATLRDPGGALTPAELAAVPLFTSLPPGELRRAARLFAVRSYPKGGVVIAEGDDPVHFHVILSGHVQPQWRDETGHQLNLGVDGAGDHFADATLSGEPVLASFVAVTDLRVGAIRMTDFRRLLERHPRLAAVLLMDVVARFRRLLQRTRTLTMEGVYGRVVKLLLARAVETGGKLVTEPLTHVEIGYRVGATREMVGRILRDLARGGYIRSERGRITILRALPRRW